MYYYNGAQRYEQFLQVGQLYRALILLSLALFRAPLCLWSSWCYIYIYVLKFFCLHPSLYLLVSSAWWDWPLTSLTNHNPSVLWHCRLGHLTRKIVSEMTYDVSIETLNTTIPIPHSVYLYVHISLCFTLHVCLAVFFIFFLFYFFYFFCFYFFYFVYVTTAGGE